MSGSATIAKPIHPFPAHMAADISLKELAAFPPGSPRENEQDCLRWLPAVPPAQFLAQLLEVPEHGDAPDLDALHLAVLIWVFEQRQPSLPPA